MTNPLRELEALGQSIWLDDIDEEFAFAYGEDFAQHIEAFHPTFAKVLVRYNPEGDAALNQRQVSRLKRLSDYLYPTQTLFMFELLVPASADATGTV